MDDLIVPVPKMSAVETRVRADVLRAAVGPGPAWLVRPTTPPSMAVEVANVVIAIGHVDRRSYPPGREGFYGALQNALAGCVDLVCLDVRDGLVTVRVLHGVPSLAPARPVAPFGLLPIAAITVAASAVAIASRDIEEIRP